MISGGRYKTVARATFVGAVFGIAGLLASTSVVNAAPLGITIDHGFAGQVLGLGDVPLLDWDVNQSITANPVYMNSTTGAVVSPLHEAYATGGTSAGSLIDLHSRSMIQIETGEADKVLAYGYSLITLADSLQVISGPAGGQLSFSWDLHGKSRLLVTTSAGSSGLYLKDQPFDLGFRVGGEFAVVGSALPRDRLGVSGYELSNASPIPTGIAAYTTYYDVSEVQRSRDTFGPLETQRDFVSDRTITRSSILPLSGPVGNFTDVEFSLLSGYSVYLDRFDTNPLFTINDSDLSNTATLVSVELLNPDGTPYIGDWSLSSAAGFIYPIIVRGAVDPGDPGAVPAPAAGLLLLAAIGGLAALRRRKA